MTVKNLKALDSIAAALLVCFDEHYHKGIQIVANSRKNLVATWRSAPPGFKDRRWELSIRFPGDLINHYTGLDEASKRRAMTRIRNTILQFVGGLENLKEDEIKNPASYICELDERIFD